MTSTDPTMAAIVAAVALGRDGDPEAARALYDDPARSLAWDVRALDAADALTDERVDRHHPGLRVAGFYPSLHLNLADGFRRLGSFDAAREHVAAGRRRVGDLPDDGYGVLIRRALEEVGAAIEQRSTAPRPSAPGPGA